MQENKWTTMGKLIRCKWWCGKRVAVTLHPTRVGFRFKWNDLFFLIKNNINNYFRSASETKIKYDQRGHCFFIYHLKRYANEQFRFRTFLRILSFLDLPWISLVKIKGCWETKGTLHYSWETKSVVIQFKKIFFPNNKVGNSSFGSLPKFRSLHISRDFLIQSFVTSFALHFPSLLNELFLWHELFA